MLLERMLVVQGYLHSDRSGRLDARLDAGKLIVTPQRNPVTNETLKRVIRKLVKMSPALGVAPVAPLLQEMLPGRGYHSGGSFPMRARPVRGETDALGRPYGRRRIYIVDSSVFPSIPAATITLAVMANAWRIGHES
jgi:choline dehydrogenase-like flavoprotein